MGCAEAPDYDNDGGRINSLDVSTLPHPYLALTGPLLHPYLTQSTVWLCVCVHVRVCVLFTPHPSPLTPYCQGCSGGHLQQTAYGLPGGPQAEPSRKFPDAILGATMATIEASEDSLWDVQKLQTMTTMEAE